MSDFSSSAAGTMTVHVMNGSTESYVRPITMNIDATLDDLASQRNYKLSTSSVAIMRATGEVFNDPLASFVLKDQDMVSITIGKNDGGSGPDLLGAVRAAMTLSQSPPASLAALLELGDVLAQPGAIGRLKTILNLVGMVEQFTAAAPIAPVRASAAAPCCDSGGFEPCYTTPCQAPAPAPVMAAAKSTSIKVVIAGKNASIKSIDLSTMSYPVTVEDIIDELGLDVADFKTIAVRGLDGAIAEAATDRVLSGGEQLMFHPRSGN